MFPEDRHLLIGFGALNQEIARDLVQKQIPITVVSREFDSAARDLAYSFRTVLLERDIRRDGAIDGLHLGRCKRIIIACGEDSLTLEIARRVGRKYCAIKGMKSADGVVHAHFSSTEMYRQLMRSRDTGIGSEWRFNGFAIREETARHLIARAWLVEQAVYRKQDRVHVIVAGAGDLGLAITREVLQNGCSGLLERPPLITVVDKDGKEAKARFKAAMPRLFDETIPVTDRPTLQFFTHLIEAIGFADAHEDQSSLPGIGSDFITDRRDQMPKTDPVTAWVICCPEDIQNLTMAMKLETAMRQGLIPPAPIFPRQWQANVTDSTHIGLGQADPLHLMAPFGGIDDVVETLSIMDPTLTDIAREIHSDYLASQEAMKQEAYYWKGIRAYGMPPWPEGTGPSDRTLRQKIEVVANADKKRFRQAWDDLQYEGRLSNIEPAKQAALRLWELGYDWRGRHVGALPSARNIDLNTHISEDIGQALSGDDLLSKIAAAEHRRWMIERALRGWSSAHSEGRSNELRLHHDFTTFRELRKNRKEEDVRTLDIATVRGTLRGLTLNDNGVEPRLLSGHDAVEIDAVNTPLKGVSRLILHLPDRPLNKSELKTSLNHLKSWLSEEVAISICLKPESAETLDPDNIELRSAIVAIYDEEARLYSKTNRGVNCYGVHIWLDFPDACDLRKTKVRTK